MPKDAKFTIRINNADLEFLEQNLPPSISSISDLFRSGAKQLALGEKSEGGVIDLSEVSEIITEANNKVISEIHQNRSLIVFIQSILQDTKTTSVANLKQLAINQLLEVWLDDLQALSSHTSLKSLEESVKFDHLRDVALDAIKELVDRKLLTVTPGGKLKWNL